MANAWAWDQAGEPTRREALRLAGALAAGCAVPAITMRPAAATPADMQAAIARIIGDAKLKSAGSSSRFRRWWRTATRCRAPISVESPMTAADHVKAIHVFNEKNPQPNVISVWLGPRAGRASISTRMRLSDTQTVRRDRRDVRRLVLVDQRRGHHHARRLPGGMI